MISEKQRLKMKEYYIKNKDQIRLAHKVYYELHKDRCKERANTWVNSNRERNRKVSSLWYALHKEELSVKRKIKREVQRIARGKLPINTEWSVDNWDIGWKDAYGRVIVYFPDYPETWKNKGRVRRSYVVWFMFTGKPVPHGYVLHHRDFDISNDCIFNLQLLLVREHKSLHMKERWRVAKEQGRNRINTKVGD